MGADPSQRSQPRARSARPPTAPTLFRRLVAASDAVFANFKPGTLASLGFSYDELRRRQPAHRAGREQRVRRDRAVERPDGLRPPGARHHRHQPAVDLRRPGDTGFYDATTIFPDHVVARITAIAALAALIDRDDADAGAHVHISQAEAAVNQLADDLRRRRRPARRVSTSSPTTRSTPSTRARATTSGA